MIEHPFCTQASHGPYETSPTGYFVLEEGYTLRDRKFAYAMSGEPKGAKDNAILVTTWYSGMRQIPRDVCIGPEHALNPDEYFIVIANRIGDGLSSSRPTTPTARTPWPASRASG